MVDGLLDARSNVFGIIAGYNFNLHLEMVHLLHGCHRHLKLVDAAKLPDHIFDCRRVDVYTADCHHVVAAAQQPAIESRKSAAASARSEIHPHEISGAITDDGKSRAA